MKKVHLIFILITMLFLIVSGCSINEQSKEQKQKQKVELTISAASSLQDALHDLTAAFEKEYPHVKINYNFGASGALQQQISQGAPVDLFFSAAEDKFDKLVEKGLIEKEKGNDLVGNEIVLVVSKDGKQEIRTFEDLTKADKISIGTPEAVPAGKYAKDTLETLNVWNAVEGKMVYAKDVRQVLTYVETGNVEAGIVYKTDALLSAKVEIIATANENSHAPIIYPVGVINSSSHPKEAQLFLEYLQNNKSMKTFETYGFKGLN
ncbi:molybdate ABC transporter substrate-binding protein [Domibacillus epiphyticus]|uniref:Molybdate ABC transporter substrate-binding protein n=1 Tax=Domibacillus epiphyticus TaxID=1714355 RepID=A0A1V2ABF2_9BACI|nr:molybdate ABC transporter substrate-binding protein [Domibacillus epiphyticus]OMP68325.1 molybdate ABC transporter substrate-binding protein [Domibacillus epiphyticus]